MFVVFRIKVVSINSSNSSTKFVFLKAVSVVSSEIKDLPFMIKVKTENSAVSFVDRTKFRKF